MYSNLFDVSSISLHFVNQRAVQNQHHVLADQKAQPDCKQVLAHGSQWTPCPCGANKTYSGGAFPVTRADQTSFPVSSPWRRRPLITA
jgi:hypothetical protein